LKTGEAGLRVREAVVERDDKRHLHAGRHRAARAVRRTPKNGDGGCGSAFAGWLWRPRGSG
jgi:hypothetical protein